jgi:hypothetical protein
MQIVILDDYIAEHEGQSTLQHIVYRESRRGC